MLTVKRQAVSFLRLARLRGVFWNFGGFLFLIPLRSRFPTGPEDFFDRPVVTAPLDLF